MAADHPAINPSRFGYHHGPYIGKGPVPVSRVNTGVCQVAIDSSNRMCGRSFKTVRALYRHMEEAHPNLELVLPEGNTSYEEIALGEAILRQYVLSGGWRNAMYLTCFDPGWGPDGGTMEKLAKEYNTMAKDSRAFSQTHGMVFNRRIVDHNPDYKPLRRVRKPLILTGTTSTKGIVLDFTERAAIASALPPMEPPTIHELRDTSIQPTRSQSTNSAPVLEPLGGR
ncbi:hypothetical protein BJ170DRAFT_592911 [Xylariales sp. AK1849]|nr:hypothetical protein BJ170DRAFT_592911 [Xylariales sp. AK1849]